MTNHQHHKPSTSHTGHSHNHSHSHPVTNNPKNHSRAFALAIVLNSAFVIVEFSYGFIANSTALMADAGHNLSDVLGLLLAWGAAILSRRSPSKRYTYGLRSTSILAALANAMLLLVACGAIALEAAHRFSQPPLVAGLTVTMVAGIGIIINGLSAWLFIKGSESDLNIRGAFLHMAADTAISLGVALTGLVIIYTGWHWLDPAISLAIVIVIVFGTWGLLREAVKLALIAVPAHIDVNALETYLRQCDGVTDIHDLHIWGMSTTESALTVHLVMPAGYPGDQFMDTIVHTLKEQFSVQHCTLQIEQGTTQHSCTLQPCKSAHAN